MAKNGGIEMRNQQVNLKHGFMTGIYFSKFKLNGKTRLYKNWDSTSGAKLIEESILKQL